MLAGGLNMLPTVGAARPSWSPADEAALRRALDSLGPEGRKNGTGPNPAAQNPPLYYAYAAVPYWAGRLLGLDFTGRLMLVRWATSLLYLATIALTWLFVAELVRARWARVLAAALVALIPQLAFIGAIVNPDIMLVAIWTAFLALSARVFTRGPTTRRVLGIGALTAASALTHGRGLLLLPPAAAAVALACWQHRVGWGAALREAAGALGLVAAGGLTALLVTRSASGGAAFGGVATANSAGTTPRGLIDYLWQFYLGRRGLIGPESRPRPRLPAGLGRELLRPLRHARRRLLQTRLRRPAGARAGRPRRARRSRRSCGAPGSPPTGGLVVAFAAGAAVAARRPAPDRLPAARRRLGRPDPAGPLPARLRRARRPRRRRDLPDAAAPGSGWRSRARCWPSACCRLRRARRSAAGRFWRLSAGCPARRGVGAGGGRSSCSCSARCCCGCRGCATRAPSSPRRRHPRRRRRCAYDPVELRRRRAVR